MRVISFSDGFSSSSTPSGTPFAFAAGSAAAPALYFGTSTTSGFYLRATNSVGIATAGVERAYFTAGGTFVVTEQSFLQLGNTAAGSSAMARGTTDGSVNLSGGTGSSNGANVNFYGGSHATKPNNIEIRQGSTNRIVIDATGLTSLVGNLSVSGTGRIQSLTTAGPVSTDASGNLSSQATLPASQMPLPTSRTKTAAYTALATDTIVIMDCSTTGSFSTTLPSAATGRPIWITRKDASFTAANTATISRAGSDTIVDNGTTATTTTLATQNESVLLMPDGTSSWFVASRNYPRKWSTYTLTWGGTTSAPTIPTSGVTVNVASYRREGAGMWIRYEYKQTATTGSAAGSGTYLFPIPSGFTIDTANLGTLGDDASCIAGTASWKFGTNIYTAKVSVLNSTNLILQFMDVTAASNAWTAFASGTSSIAGQANVEFSFLVYVPIAGWN